MAASRLERLLQRQSSRMTGRHEQVPRGHVGGDCDQGAVLSQHRTEQARFHHVVLGLRLARRRQKLAVLPLVDLHIFTHLVLQAGKRSAIEHRHLDQPSQIPNLDQPSQIPILVSDHGASREKEDNRHLDQPGQIPILVSGRGACREATFPVLHAGGVVMMER